MGMLASASICIEMQLDCSVFKSDESVHYNIQILDTASCVPWASGAKRKANAITM